jgi:predicted permease
MQVLVQTVIPVFSIISLGYAIGKLKKFDIQTLIDLIVYISGPCLIFSSITSSNLNLTDFTTIAGAALTIILAMALLAFLAFKLTHSAEKGLYLPIIFGNTSYLGYPVALFAFGMAGLSRAVVFDMMNSLVIFSLGIYIVHHRNELRESLKIPLLYAVIIGLLVNLSKMPVPPLIAQPIEMLGMITIPLALLVLGYKLTEVNLNAPKIAVLASASAFRIIGGVFVALLIIQLFAIEDGLTRDVIILQAAMPSAVMSMILAAKYKRDASLVASVVLITTVLSIISIPLILSVLCSK